MTSASEHRTGSSGIRQLFAERRARDRLYGTSTYWDARASARSGMARSLWPSNTFNELWDERQRAVVARAFGDLRGRRVLDVGCGVGRMARFLVEGCGAREVVGVDFSAATVEAARSESGALHCPPCSASDGRDPRSTGTVSFEQGDVVAGLDRLGVGAFDDAVLLGCLSVACRDRPTLERAFANVARVIRREGRLLLLEPIHRSPLLRRVLDLGLEEWIACANAAGLSLVRADRMGFFPVRLFFSVRDLPPTVVGPIFRAGERLLDTSPWLAPLSDYKLLLFSRARDGAGP